MGCFFDRSLYETDAYLFYFVKDAKDYEQKHFLQNSQSDFNQIVEEIDNIKVVTHTKIINVDTPTELQFLMDNMISTLYDEHIVNEPKNISLFEVYT